MPFKFSAAWFLISRCVFVTNHGELADLENLSTFLHKDLLYATVADLCMYKEKKA